MTKGGLQISIKMHTGKRIDLEVEGTDLVQDVKEKIKQKEGIPIENQVLVYAGTIFQNGNTLDDYNIQKIDTIHLVIRLKGG